MHGRSAGTMGAFLGGNPPGGAHNWQRKIKEEAYRKVLASPLLQACAAGDGYPRALLGGFWYFVNAFPGILRDTYTKVPSAAAGETARRFLRRAAPALSETLRGMEGDERTHRGLWIRAAQCTGLSVAALQEWKVLPEIREMTDLIRTEEHLGRRLLYFVGVEIVAESVARFLAQSPPFVAAMGKDGMLWFEAHLAPSGGAGTHEALAYRLALSVKLALGEPIDEHGIGDDIQRCVDWFVAGGIACQREFAPAPGP